MLRPEWTLLSSNVLLIAGCGILAAGVLNHIFRRRRLGPSVESFPGPPTSFLLGNIKDFPKDAWPETFTAWQREYGDITCLKLPGLNFLVLNNIDDVEEILVKRTNVWAGRPYNYLVNVMIGMGWGLLQLQPGHRFNENRKVFRKVLGPKAVADYDVHVEHELEALVRQVEGFTGNPFDSVWRSLGKLIVTVSYGSKVYEAAGEELVKVNHDAMELVTDTFAQVWLVNILPLVRRLPSWFPGLAHRPIVERGSRLMRIVRSRGYNMAREQIERGIVDDSVIAKYFNEPDFNNEHLRDAVSFIYFGAIHTTSTAVINFLAKMLLYPDVQRKVQAELDELVGKGNLPSSSSIQSAKYLKATWKELIRHDPPLPTGIPHLNLVDDHWKGRFIPRGTLVTWNGAFMLRDPRYWGDDAEEFKPERFLPEFNPRASELPDVDAIVFGYGRRICAGKDFGVRTSMAYVAALLSMYEIHPPPGQPRPTSIEYTTTQARRAVMQCHFVPRR